MASIARRNNCAICTRRRAARLYEWLLEISMDLRGSSPLPERTLLEKFLLKMAR